MESQIWCLPCPRGERAQKRSNGICQQFCLRESCPLSLALMPDTSVLPYVPLVPFKLLPWCWSSMGVSLSKSVCGPFRRNCLRIKPFLLSIQSPLVFTDRSHRDLSSRHWNPRLWGLVWGWDSSVLRYPSRFLSATCG